jgi:hypothetical protein
MNADNMHGSPRMANLNACHLLDIPRTTTHSARAPTNFALGLWDTLTLKKRHCDHPLEAGGPLLDDREVHDCLGRLGLECPLSNQVRFQLHTTVPTCVPIDFSCACLAFKFSTLSVCDVPVKKKNTMDKVLVLNILDHGSQTGAHDRFPIILSVLSLYSDFCAVLTN